MFSKKLMALAICASFFGVQMSAFASGFEKSVLWSAKWSALGGAASAAVNDSESLYFNPAGLGSDDQVISVSGHFSPTFGKFKGPVLTDNVIVDSEREMSPVFGGFAKYRLADGLGLGIGAYVAGGTNAVFENVTFPTSPSAPFTMDPDAVTKLSVIEYSIGVGYAIPMVEGLRVGAAWRLSDVGARFATPVGVQGSGLSSVLVAADLDDLKATRYNGWRLGLQYAPRDAGWGLGITYRSEVGFIAKTDNATTFTNAVTSPNTINESTGSASISGLSLPQQVSMGGFYDVVPGTARAFLEYTFTNYAVNRRLDAGSFVKDLNWKNQHNVRVGTELGLIESFPIRAGYVWTSQVTPNDRALATLASPGDAHTFALGTGTTFMDGAIGADLAGEYSMVSGDGEAPATLGEYSANAYAIHASVRFGI